MCVMLRIKTQNEERKPLSSKFFFKFHIARIEWLEVICGYELQIFGNPEKLCLNDYFGHFIFLSNENFDKSLSASAINKM